jgi:long-chain acyl-CoA synthetase
MSTLSAALQRTALIHGSRVAVVDADLTLTWRQFAARVASLATVLRARGCKRGTHFGVLAANSYRQAELFHAAYWIGAVPVPVNTRLAPLEIQDLLSSTDCAWVATDSMCEPLLNHPELQSWHDGRLELGRPSLEDAIAAAEPAPRALIGGSDEALLLHTGGTAGRAKCVVLRHREVIANGLQVSFAWPGDENDIALHVAPMFHSADLVMTGLMLRGAAHAWLARFTPADFLRAIETHRVTATMIVPTMLILTLQSGLLAQHDLSSLRRLLYGASPLTREWVAAAIKALPGVAFTQGYGLTETAPIVSMLDWPSHLAWMDAPPGAAPSCGRPLPGIDLRIVDDQARDVGPGQAGEIILRGPNVFSGYHRMPTADAVALRDGWFHTGDIARQDETGLLYILDRKKDVVNVGGDKVYSIEVEAVLMQHPDIVEAAVVAVPSSRFGESVFAVLVCRPGTAPTKKALRDFCRSRLGGFKIPTAMAFVDALPKSALGKVLKSDLKRTYSRAPA